MKSNLKSTTDQFSFVLRPSKVEGIGVFALHGVKKGTALRLFPNHEKVKKLKALPKGKDYFERYCVEVDGALYAPEDFGRMSIGWFLNHSTRPNARHVNYRYFAARDIKAGEEIMIDYRTLEES